MSKINKWRGPNKSGGGRIFFQEKLSGRGGGGGGGDHYLGPKSISAYLR